MSDEFLDMISKMCEKCGIKEVQHKGKYCEGCAIQTRRETNNNWQKTQLKENPLFRIKTRERKKLQMRNQLERKYQTYVAEMRFEKVIYSHLPLYENGVVLKLGMYTSFPEGNGIYFLNDTLTDPDNVINKRVGMTTDLKRRILYGYGRKEEYSHYKFNMITFIPYKVDVDTLKYLEDMWIWAMKNINQAEYNEVKIHTKNWSYRDLTYYDKETLSREQEVVLRMIGNGGLAA